MPLCPCYNKEWDKCLFPDSIQNCKVKISFKDEPEKFQEWKDCPYQKNYMGTYVDMDKITRVQYFKMMKENVYCMHDKIPFNKLGL